LGRQNLGDLGPLRRQGDSDSHPAVQGSVQVRQGLGALPPQGLEPQIRLVSGLQVSGALLLQVARDHLGRLRPLLREGSAPLPAAGSGPPLELDSELLLVLAQGLVRHLVSGPVLRVASGPQAVQVSEPLDSVQHRVSKHPLSVLSLLGRPRHSAQAQAQEEV